MEASLNDIMMVILMKRLSKRLSKSVLAGNYENTVGLRILCAENIGDILIRGLWRACHSDSVLPA
jgi:hypothetical protein